MVNFGLLAAEIRWRVWCTPANFNGFRILAALLHGILVVGVSQTLRRQGATYIRQGGHHVGHWRTFLVQTDQLEQVNTFPCLGSLITEDGECTTEFRTRLSRGQAIGASLQKIWKSHSIPILTNIRLMKALVCPVAT